MDLFGSLSMGRAQNVRVCWVIAETFNDPLTDPDALAGIGSTWGSWRTWRAWNTDNVLCNDAQKAKDLTTRAFQAVCNLYIPKKDYVTLERPVGVKLYEGEFPTEFEGVEDIVGMHLVSGHNDLVLLLGFDLSTPDQTDAYELHKRKNYLAAFRAALKMYPQTQWVLINHQKKLDPSFEGFENITCDTYENVLQLLG